MVTIRLHCCEHDMSLHCERKLYCSTKTTLWLRQSVCVFISVYSEIRIFLLFL